MEPIAVPQAFCIISQQSVVRKTNRKTSAARWSEGSWLNKFLWFSMLLCRDACWQRGPRGWSQNATQRCCLRTHTSHVNTERTPPTDQKSTQERVARPFDSAREINRDRWITTTSQDLVCGSSQTREGGKRDRALYGQPTRPNPLNHRDD